MYKPKAAFATLPFRESWCGFFYDYYLRDHLNNVCTVLTEQKDTTFYPPASFETASLGAEKLYWQRLEEASAHYYRI
jgi:hypothetical protein